MRVQTKEITALLLAAYIAYRYAPTAEKALYELASALNARGLTAEYVQHLIKKIPHMKIEMLLFDTAEELLREAR